MGGGGLHAKKERKMWEVQDNSRGGMERSGAGGYGLSLKFSYNKLSEGHSRKMRDAKYLTKKLAADMAVIFKVRADAYSLAPPPLPPSRFNPKRSTTPPDGGENVSAVAERNKRRRDKKRYDDDGLSVGAVEKK